MFTSVRVENFKAFSNVSVAPLRRLNLVTGYNGAGKTCLLEAVFLLCGANNAALATSIADFRNEPGASPDYDGPFRTMFHKSNVNAAIKISGNGWPINQKRARSLTISPKWEAKAELATSVRESKIVGVNFDFNGPSGKAEGESSWEPMSAQALEQRRATRGYALSSKGKISKDLINAIFVSPYFRNLWSQSYRQLTIAIKENRIPAILESLRIVEPRIKNILPLSEAGIELIYVDIGYEKLMPATTLGAGFLHVLHLILASSSLSPGVILVDEIEDGLHFSIIDKIIRFIIKWSQLNELQFFISTHSEEVINKFVESSVSEQFSDFELIRLVRDDGGVSARIYDMAELQTAQNISLELR